MLRGLNRIAGNQPQGKRSRVSFGDGQVVSFPLKLHPWTNKGSRTPSKCEDKAATEGRVGLLPFPKEPISGSPEQIGKGPD